MYRMLGSYSTVLRLYPSVPVNMRQAMNPTVLPVGGGPDRSSPVFVRKGEAVSYSVYAMHRRKDLYGEDADQFRPDRWDSSSEKALDLRNIGWGYLPFNGGPRVCLGRECTSFLITITPNKEFLITFHRQSSLLCWKLRIRLYAFCKRSRTSS